MHLAFVKMPKEYINLIILQDTLPIILTAKITSETQNKGHYVYEDTWTPKLIEQFEAYYKLENIT